MPGINPAACSIISLRCGIAGVALCWLPVANIALAIFAIILSLKAKKALTSPGRAAAAGLVLGIIGLLLSVLMSLILLGLLP